MSAIYVAIPAQAALLDLPLHTDVAEEYDMAEDFARKTTTDVARLLEEHGKAVSNYCMVRGDFDRRRLGSHFLTTTSPKA